MNSKQSFQRNAGFFTFFLSGFCGISAGIIVSLLQEAYGFRYSMTGTLLSFMNIGNLLAGFICGILPAKIGMKATVVLLTAGYGIGYFLMGLSGWTILLMAAFFLVGTARGSAINTCTVLVGDHSKNRARGLNLLHGCFALGALLCPFAIRAAEVNGPRLPMFVLALCGAMMWLTFAATPMENAHGKNSPPTDWSFFKSKRFWLIAGLLFCQTGAETSVAGWVITYFKDSGIISPQLSPYTVTIMWSGTLIARMLIVFVLPIRNIYSAMITMSIGAIVFYLGLIAAHTQTAALLLLFAYAFAMAGMNPTIMSCAGKMTTVTSVGILLPISSIGTILMSWLVGMIAEHSSISMGMASNLILYLGMLLFSIAIKRLPE